MRGGEGVRVYAFPGFGINVFLSTEVKIWLLVFIPCTGCFFYCSALKMTKYKEKLKYPNCSANCSSWKVLSNFSNFSVKTLSIWNVPTVSIGGKWGVGNKRDMPLPPRCSYNYNFGGGTKKNGHCSWKRPYHPPFKIGPETPKTPIWVDFLYFHNRYSGARIIRF